MLILLQWILLQPQNGPEEVGIIIILMFNWCICSADVVHAYRNLLQEKEALEASITVLTTNNQSANNQKKDTAEHPEPKDQSEKLENDENSSFKAEGATSPVYEQVKEKVESVDHPLAVKEDEAENAIQSQPDKV